MGYYQHILQTQKRQQFIDITQIIQSDIDIQEGILVIYTPHTTCGLTINENSDPTLVNDMIYGYEKVYPTNDKFYHHLEGNSSAHMKSSAFGCNQTLIVHQGEIMLGLWQAIYLCEFDGPKERSFFVKTIEG